VVVWLSRRWLGGGGWEGERRVVEADLRVRSCSFALDQNMLLLDNWTHGDLHPGNIMVRFLLPFLPSFDSRTQPSSNSLFSPHLTGQILQTHHFSSFQKPLRLPPRTRSTLLPYGRFRSSQRRLGRHRRETLPPRSRSDSLARGIAYVVRDRVAA